MLNILKVLLFSIIAYVFLFIIAKLLGKKQIAELTFIDYVVGITIGSIAAEMATETQEPFYHYLIAMAIFFIFDLIVSVLGKKSAALKKFTNGKPLILICDGKMQYEAIKKSKITADELVGMARDKGYFDIDEVAFAIFETSGKLSLMPKAEFTPIVSGDMDIQSPKPKLIDYLVVDGKISKDALIACGKDEKWLLEGMGVNGKKELDCFMLAHYDNAKQKFIVHRKS